MTLQVEMNDDQNTATLQVIHLLEKNPSLKDPTRNSLNSTKSLNIFILEESNNEKLGTQLKVQYERTIVLL